MLRLKLESFHSSVVTSQSELFSQLVLMDFNDEGEVQISSSFDTGHRRRKLVMKRQPVFCWLEENTEMLESKRSEKKLNDGKKMDHEGKKKMTKCDKRAL